MITEVINVLTGIFEAIISLMFIGTFVDKSKNSKFPLWLAVVILAVMINLSNRVVGFTMINVYLMALSIFIVACIRNRNIKLNLILSVVSILILAVCEVATMFCIVNIAKVSPEVAAMNDSYRILGIVLSKLAAFIIFKLISLTHKENHAFAMKTSYWMLFLIMFSISVLAIFLIFKLQLEANIPSMYTMSVFGSFGLMYNTFFSLYLYEHISRQAEIEHKRQIFEQQVNDQSKHFGEILVAHQELKKLRHDLANHNIAIEAFFENEDCKAGLEYMRDINRFTKLSKDVVETGNIALDAIVNTKKAIAVSKNIEFVTNIQVPNNIFVDATDICVIFGNALDNSIEACDKIQNGPKKITLSVVYEDNSLICKIVNTAVNNNNKSLLTTKRDKVNHGFGLQNIKATLAKYKNVCNFKQTDDEFILSFVIFND